MGQDEGHGERVDGQDPPGDGPPEEDELETAPAEPLEQAQDEPRPAGQEAWRGARMDDQAAQNWAVGAHLAGLSWLLSIPGLVGPLIIWLVKGEEHPLIEDHAREAVNFQLSILIYGLVSAVLVLLLIGILLLVLVALMAIILPIIAAVKTSEGEAYRYPLTMRLIN